MISILIIIAYSIEPKLDLQEIPEQGHGCRLPSRNYKFITSH